MDPWREIIGPDEQARFERYAAQLRGLQKARAARLAQQPSRALHLKAHLGATGTLTVKELPANLRVGPFAAPAVWPLYVRFSNGTNARQPDRVPDIRGVALKLVGVPGKKLIPGLEDKKTQDFLLIQTPALLVAVPDDFVALVMAASKGNALLLPRLLCALGLKKTLAIVQGFASLPKVPSMATARFHTGAPLRFGEHAAKLDLVPLCDDVPEPRDGENGLRDDLVERLSRGPVEYQLRAQLFASEASTPIEDASVCWPESVSPFLALGVVTIPQQDVRSPRGQEVERRVEGFSFDPWHAVEELRPLGAVMRARAVAYRESTAERQAAPEPDEVL